MSQLSHSTSQGPGSRWYLTPRHYQSRIAHWWHKDLEEWDALEPVTRAEMQAAYEAEMQMQGHEQAEELKRQKAAQRKRGRRK